MEKIIIPLDGLNSIGRIIKIVDDVQKAEILAGEKIIWGFKVNDALIDYGTSIVRRIKTEGFRVFADPKLEDIPNTINNSLSKLIDAGADKISVHCSAQYMPTEGQKKYIAGIMILTSMTEEQCKHVYGRLIKDMVYRFWADANNYGYYSLVCSPKDLNIIPFNDPLLKITPGIRPEWYQKKDDQNRVATPAKAIKKGADLLVIGRPILRAENMIDAIKRTNEEIEIAEAEMIEEKKEGK